MSHRRARLRARVRATTRGYLKAESITNKSTYFTLSMYMSSLLPARSSLLEYKGVGGTTGVEIVKAVLPILLIGFLFCLFFSYHKVNHNVCVMHTTPAAFATCTGAVVHRDCSDRVFSI